jgi:nitric oxide reductase large subunit
MAHRVFISYHHANDQGHKNGLVKWAKENDIFVDWSVDTGDISDDLTDQEIRQEIRDEYLQDSTVTIVLIGTETKNRKHVDWEIYSSMYDGKVNKKSGIIVINLPSVHCTSCHASHSGEHEHVFHQISSWTSITERTEYERRYPYMPDRIIDNLLTNQAKISVISWDDLTVDKLKFMIEKAFEDRENSKYDLSRPMRRRNS